MLLVALLGNGCALARWVKNGFKVGPEYVEPAAPTASRWIDYQDPRVKSEEVDLSRWWRVFNDPILDSLIERASLQNLSLQAAAERIAASRSRRNIAIGTLFPQQQEAFGSLSRNRLSEETADAARTDSFTEWSLGGSVAWELDFWGRFRRAIQVAAAELQASIADYDDLLVILLSEVASNYVQYRTFQERLTYVRKNVEAQRGSFEIAQDRFRAGAVPEREVFEARQILEQTRALIPLLETGLRQANNALCVLVGIPPQDLSDVLGGDGRVPVVAPDIAAGIPAELIRRRPDIRRAERLAAAQSAFIGVAESELYPHFSILGTFGVQAENFSDLFTQKALTASIGPAFRWDLFHYGRLISNVRAQEAGFRELVLAYQQAVLQAGREAEDSLYGFLKAHEIAAFLSESTQAAQRVLEIANNQFLQGAVDFTTVYIFQEALTEQEDRLATARGEIALNLIRLYRALGGGWNFRPAEAGAVAGGAGNPARAAAGTE